MQNKKQLESRFHDLPLLGAAFSSQGSLSHEAGEGFTTEPSYRSRTQVNLVGISLLM